MKKDEEQGQKRKQRMNRRNKSSMKRCKDNQKIIQKKTKNKIKKQGQKRLGSSNN